MSERIVVVGGGASGLMAAGRAAELGARVLVVEKTRRLGTKLRLTGDGHCNLTHLGEATEWAPHLLGDGPFMRNALARFGVAELMGLFQSLGVPLAAQEDGRVFPVSRNAHDVVAALRTYCLRGNVQFRYDSRVSEIITAEGRVAGVRVGDTAISASAVILCTGGATYPETGSTADGYRLARHLGHTIAPLRPGLVPLKVQEPWVGALQGLALRAVRGTLYSDARVLHSAQDDLMFTHYGLSGPLALALSSRLGDSLRDGSARLVLDLLPSVDEPALDRALRSDLAPTGKAAYHNAVGRWVPRRLADQVAERAGLAPQVTLGELDAAARRRIVQTLKAFALTIVGTLPAREALITLGGVPGAEVWPESMASRIVQGFYLAGEMLNVKSGDSGGYNLQIAFTTGYVAGEASARAWLNTDA